MSEDWTELGSGCWSKELMLLVLSWEWVSSAIVLNEASELCRRGF